MPTYVLEISIVIKADDKLALEAVSQAIAHQVDVLALAKVMPNVLEEWKGRRHNFGTGCALEIIGAMVKMGVI